MSGTAAARKAAWLPSCVPMARHPACLRRTDTHTTMTGAAVSCIQTVIRVAHCAALFAFLVGALTGLAVAASGTSEAADMRHETLGLVTASGTKTINIEVAVSMEEQMRGLMFRTSLADNSGMLFPYSPPRELTMWMKNTYIPLDMVFIRDDGVVHRIEARTEPLSGGADERLGLKPGDRIDHPIFKSK
jgi:uncharacterized protein